MLSELKPALRLLLVMTVLTGVLYPLAITGLAHVLFPFQARGSLIEIDGRIVGSAVVGQRFSRPDHFQSRPSAAGPEGYDATRSGASNLAVTSRRLIADITARAALQRATSAMAPTTPIPADLVMGSGSGLDPDLSPAAARYQVPRVAQARGLDPERVELLVNLLLEKRTLGILGEPRVNLLKLNLALDEMGKAANPAP